MYLERLDEQQLSVIWQVRLELAFYCPLPVPEELEEPAAAGEAQER
jgi:hypothetical protein